MTGFINNLFHRSYGVVYRWQVGAGAGAGEDMEQLFSYLSRLGITTKNNTAAGAYTYIHTYIHTYVCTEYVCAIHIANRYVPYRH